MKEFLFFISHLHSVTIHTINGYFVFQFEPWAIITAVYVFQQEI